MVRTYKRKTQRSSISENAVRQAIQDVKNGNTTMRQAARRYSLKKSMLHKRLLKFKSKMGSMPIPESLVSQDEAIQAVLFQDPSKPNKYATQRVFSIEQERMLESYLIDSANVNYGLTYEQMREFAYDYALKLDLNIPATWEEHKKAGVDRRMAEGIHEETS
uniref:HTH psq-type domain-containing protein n=1 Tax=Cacopsylla melanoneura TaxID=428564 RepID=A0A8D8W7V0_9HEMI